MLPTTTTVRVDDLFVFLFDAPHSRHGVRAAVTAMRERFGAAAPDDYARLAVALQSAAWTFHGDWSDVECRMADLEGLFLVHYALAALSGFAGALARGDEIACERGRGRMLGALDGAFGAFADSLARQLDCFQPPRAWEGDPEAAKTSYPKCLTVEF